MKGGSVVFEYLFDSNYKAAKNEYNAAKSKRNKLNNIKNDITNDTSSINSINKRIDYIYDDFAKAILVSDVKIRVSTKLNSLKEPYQTSDSALASACGEISDEIALLQQEMDNAESTMNSIKNQSNGSW